MAFLLFIWLEDCSLNMVSVGSYRAGKERSTSDRQLPGCECDAARHVR